MEQNAEATKQQGAGRRTWLVATVAVAALIAIALIAIVLVSRQEDTVYEPGSPEAVVQAYAEAWEAGDADAAWEMLTPRAQGRLERSEFSNAISWEEEMPTRVWVEERRDLDDRVMLTLTVERTWDGLLGPSRDIGSLRLTLIELDDAWRIDSPIVGFHVW